LKRKYHQIVLYRRYEKFEHRWTLDQVHWA